MRLEMRLGLEGPDIDHGAKQNETQDQSQTQNRERLGNIDIKHQTHSDVRWQMASRASLSRLTYSGSG